MGLRVEGFGFKAPRGSLRSSTMITLFLRSEATRTPFITTAQEKLNVNPHRHLSTYPSKPTELCKCHRSSSSFIRGTAACYDSILATHELPSRLSCGMSWKAEDQGKAQECSI